MFKIFLFVALILHGGQIIAKADVPTQQPQQQQPSFADTILGPSVDCLASALDTNSLYCRGSRAIRNVINNLQKSDKPIVIVRGLEIVRTSSAEQNATAPNDATTSTANGDNSFLGHFSQYLRTHELNIKFSDLLADNNESERHALKRDLERNDGVNVGDDMKIGTANAADGVEEARKKDKGQGLLLAMAMMFGKMMAVIGLGGVGALAMKALGVAMMALVMAGLVGLKSLSQQGHESGGHSVQYVAADGHHHKRRRRRHIEQQQQEEEYKPLALVYSGWLNDAKQL